MSNKNRKISIPHWAEDDKPREKLLTKGVQQLSDAELLAIILRMGSRNKSAVDLAREILTAHDNNLSAIETLGLHDLMKFQGVGEAKAIAIKAALEFGRRAHLSEIIENPVIDSSRRAYKIVSRDLGMQAHEECWVLFLNRRNQLISKECMSSGGITATVVDSRLILKRALEKLATGIILCHNHPSGNLKPSVSDRQLTKRLLEAGNLLDIKLIDHLIVTRSGYFSFADEGDLI